MYVCVYVCVCMCVCVLFFHLASNVLLRFTSLQCDESHSTFRFMNLKCPLRIPLTSAWFFFFFFFLNTKIIVKKIGSFYLQRCSCNPAAKLTEVNSPIPTRRNKIKAAPLVPALTPETSVCATSYQQSTYERCTYEGDVSLSLTKSCSGRKQIKKMCIFWNALTLF